MSFKIKIATLIFLTIAFILYYGSYAIISNEEEIENVMKLVSQNKHF